MLLLNGGTLNIEGPGQYSPQSMGLLRTIGIDLERFERDTAHDRGTYRTPRAAQRRLVQQGTLQRRSAGRGDAGARRGASEAWPDFLAKTPLAEQAQRDIARIESRTQPDYMPGLSSDDKKQKLIHMSYQDFLLNVAKVHADAVWFYQTRSTGLFLMNIDALPVYYAWNMNYPGFQGMNLEPTPPDVLVNEPGGAHGRENQERASAAGRSIHFPDGNATIARLLVRSLIPTRHRDARRRTSSPRASTTRCSIATGSSPASVSTAWRSTSRTSAIRRRPTRWRSPTSRADRHIRCAATTA